MLEDGARNSLNNSTTCCLLQSRWKMKLDGEQVFSQGPVGHESDSKPYEYNDNAADFVLKSGKSIEKQSQKDVLQDLSSMESPGDELPYCMMGEDSWISENFACSMSLEDFTPDDEKKVRDFVAPITSSDASPKIKVFDKDSVFYLDKSVMEPEPPELIVCYKERTYHAVKDICVDEGLPSQDKFLFDIDVDEKSMCNYIPATEDLKHAMVKEKCDIDKPISDILKSSQERENVDPDLHIPDLLKKSAEEKGSKGDLSLDFYSKDSIPTEEARQTATLKVENDTPKEIFSLGDLLSMPVSGEKNSYAKSSNSSLDKEEQLTLQRPIENAVSATGSSCERSENGDSGATLVSSALISPAVELNYFHEEMLAAPTLGSTSELEDHGPVEDVSAAPAQIYTREVSDRSHAMDSVSEEATETNAEELCSTSNVETRSINTSEATSSGRQECCQNGSSDFSGTQNSSRVDDPKANSILTKQLQHTLGESSSYAAGPSQLHYGFGESSFSAAGPVSGLITYSGPITYSGSISLRSDSSTTSTRSFAFPVLQSEWNSSPVRMAKGDRRRLRKHRGWKQGLLCCRF